SIGIPVSRRLSARSEQQRQGPANRFNQRDLRQAADPKRLATMRPTIRQAMPADTENVSSILREAAQWLERSGMAMWRDNELLPARIAADVEAGLCFVAECEGVTAGVVKFQLEDSLHWPDVPLSQSAFVHRLAVRR